MMQKLPLFDESVSPFNREPARTPKARIDEESVQRQGDTSGLTNIIKTSSAQSCPSLNSRRVTQSPLVLPATYQRKKVVMEIVLVEPDPRAFYKNDLDITRLNRLHEYLWLAGLKRPARSLTQQVALGRQICLTEQADMHLLWSPARLYLKPLPDYLLCFSIWETDICNDRELYEQAAGLLLSYIWLVSRQSDLRIAHEFGLIAPNVSWHTWTALTNAIASKMDLNQRDQVNSRYCYGELRLNRVNWIHRFWSQPFTSTTFLRGYRQGHYQYDTFLSQNLSWLLSGVAYVALVLTALQVGLATQRLAENSTFQAASYGFTIFAILTPIIIVIGFLTFTGVLVLFNLRFTVRQSAY